MSAILCPISLQTIFRDGRPMVGAKILIYEAGTTTPKVVYQDSIMQAAHPRPILTDGQGMVPPIYIGRGDYKIRVLTPGDIIVREVDGLPGSATASDIPDPGESYPLTDPNSVLITGDIIGAFRTGSRAGFARCNGNTIGNSYSAASEIPFGELSDQAQPLGSAYNLFIHLWELQEIGLSLPVYANGVSVGRGSTAISDWDSNRQIGLPDFRGRVPFGLDGMGGPVSNRLQRQAELTMTNGSLEAYLTSSGGIVQGMKVSGTGIRAGTIVSAITGTKVTLSLPATSTTSATVKFSMFGDANVLGSTGGVAYYNLITSQLPAHNHTAVSSSEAAGSHAHSGTTDTQGNHAHTYADSTLYAGAGAQGGSLIGTIDTQRATSTTGAHAHNFTTHAAGNHAHTINTSIAYTGSGNSYGVVPPGILMTWYIKL